MKTQENVNTRLCHLKGSDYEVADGQPDIRGWDVKDINGKEIGEVEDLIFDEHSLKVRYMVVDLDDNEFDIDDDRHVLIPVGLGEIPENDNEVVVPNVTKEQLMALPEYKDKKVTHDDEYRIRNVFAGASAAGMASTGMVNDEFYDHDNFNEQNLHRRRNPMFGNTADTASSTTDTYSTNMPGNEENTKIPVIEENVAIGKQQVKTGGAYIKARMVEKPVEEQVNLKEEHLNINRNPVNRPANSTDFDTFKEGVIEMEETAEIPVVSKEARVVEEISVNKEVSERTETVRDTIRKTEIDVEDMGGRTGTLRDNDRRDL